MGHIGAWRWVLGAGLALSILIPGAAAAHEGTGFHPEAVWALLRTGLLVAAAIAALGGILWVYERAKSRRAK